MHDNAESPAGRRLGQEDDQVTHHQVDIGGRPSFAQSLDVVASAVVSAGRLGIGELPRQYSREAAVVGRL